MALYQEAPKFDFSVSITHVGSVILCYRNLRIVPCGLGLNKQLFLKESHCLQCLLLPQCNILYKKWSQVKKKSRQYAKSVSSTTIYFNIYAMKFWLLQSFKHMLLKITRLSCQDACFRRHMLKGSSSSASDGST